ncbi:MAG TPA: TadE/TadG family type IV pilus assembly protein [Oligoflexia bacterium]|nr:TadE/TadG family type IV pilus assembly protein [Oligoflexia bacterium]
MNHTRSNFWGSEHAVALIEFAFVVPILFLVIFGSVEVSRALYHMQIAASLSREAASLVYRDCVGDPAGDPVRANQVNALTGVQFREEMDNCIEGRRAAIQQVAMRLARGSVITVTAYRHVPAAGTTPGSAEQFPAAPDPTEFGWHDKNNGIIKSAKSAAPLNARGYVVVGEAFIHFDTAFAPIWQLLGGAPQHFYDAIVL